jgi:hypothetical protein
VGEARRNTADTDPVAGGCRRCHLVGGLVAGGRIRRSSEKDEGRAGRDRAESESGAGQWAERAGLDQQSCHDEGNDEQDSGDDGLCTHW